MKKYKGVTMIELLVALTIIAILSFLAVVLYMNQILNSRRTDAINSIYAVALAEENYRSTNSLYGTLTQLSQSAASSSGYYNIAVSNVSATTYTVTATAIGEQANDAEGSTSCSTLTYAMSSGSATQTPAVCWPS